MRSRLSLVAAMSVALAAAPIGFSSPEFVSHALAKNDGPGGGQGGGNSGGAPGRDGSPGNSGNAAGHGNAFGHDKNSTAGSKPGDLRTPSRTDRTTATQPLDRRDSDRARTEARSKAANELGNLNAAHASANARANTAPNSMVGRIATYETQMLNALQLQDPTQRNAAITAARSQLAQSANKPLTESTISRVDSLLGIQGANPQLGAVR